MVARAVRGHVDHQHIVLTVHACGQGPNGALQVLGRCPRVGLRSVGMVEQVQHPPLGVKPLLQQRADHAAFAAEHVFIRIGGKHQPVDIRHARALGCQGLHLLLPQQLLVFKQALRQCQVCRFRRRCTVGRLRRGIRQRLGVLLPGLVLKLPHAHAHHCGHRQPKHRGSHTGADEACAHNHQGGQHPHSEHTIGDPENDAGHRAAPPLRLVNRHPHQHVQHQQGPQRGPR